MSEKAPDYSPAPGILPEGMYGPDNFAVKNSKTGGYETADARGFKKIDKGDIPAGLQEYFAKYADDSVFLESPAGYKVYSPDKFTAIQDAAYAERQAMRKPLYEEAERQLMNEYDDTTRPHAELEPLLPAPVEQMGEVALEAVGVQPVLKREQIVHPEERAKEREQVFSSAELGEYNSLMQEMARQAAALRQYGEQGRMRHDDDIVAQARGHLERVVSGRESADAGLVAMSSILAGIVGQGERSAVFDMMQRSNVLSDKDLQRIGGELANLAQLDQVPGLESDHRKFQYSEDLGQQAAADLAANDGVATKLYLALKAMAGGVGSRMNDASYRQRIVDGAIREIAESRR